MSINNPSRIYTVINNITGERTLVEATHPSLAVKLIVGKNYGVSVTTTAELARMLEAGARVLRQPA